MICSLVNFHSNKCVCLQEWGPDQSQKETADRCLFTESETLYKLTVIISYWKVNQSITAVKNDNKKKMQSGCKLMQNVHKRNRKTKSIQSRWGAICVQGLFVS